LTTSLSSEAWRAAFAPFELADANSRANQDLTGDFKARGKWKRKNHSNQEEDMNMKTRNIFTKLSIAIALVAIASTVTVWEVRRVRAVAPPDPERGFGMVGIAHGQTMRLNVVNLSPPDPNRQYPPDPCRVVLSFRNADGQPFTNNDGQPIRRVVELQAGESAFLDLNADAFAPPSTNADVAPAPARLQLRPFVRVLASPPDPNKQLPPDPCRASMEVFDNTSGRTSIFAGFTTPADPQREQ
jgi:hypothetical protein